jgi:acyl carrier protein
LSLPEGRFLDIVRRHVKPAYRGAVAPEAALRDDLGLDSLGVIAIMLAVEQETKLPVFEIDPTVGDVTTLRDLLALLTRREHP